MFYTYIYLDTRKPGKYVYEDYSFDFEPIYVGKGKKRRDVSHFQSAKRAEKGLNESKLKITLFKSKLSSIIKAGYEPIILRLFETEIEQEAFDLEIKLIDLIKRSVDDGPLMNMCFGGEGSAGHIMSDERKASLSKRMTGAKRPKDTEYRNEISKGVKLYFDNNPERKLELSKQRTGTKASAETKKKLSDMRKGSDNSFYGKTHTDEVRKILSKKSTLFNWYILEDDGTKTKIDHLNTFCKENEIKPAVAYTIAAAYERNGMFNAPGKKQCACKIKFLREPRK